MAKKLPSKKDAFDKHERFEVVCSHIFHEHGTNSQDKLTAMPLCVQIFDDAYNVFWYCEKCTIKYDLPPKGAYIYNCADDLEDVLSKLRNYAVSENLDSNPFNDFIENETSNKIPEKVLVKLYSCQTQEPKFQYKDIISIPFGTKTLNSKNNT